ncbi:hypothetical protein JCM10450v2_005162 [Rhodotorula kratochvilovae]
MPAPRTAASRARKSAVPDPDLYSDPHSSDRDSPPASAPPPPRKKPKPPAPALARRGSRGPQPTRGSVTTDTGRRRSSRLSAESTEALDAAAQEPSRSSTARAPAPEERDPPARQKKPPQKGKKRALPEQGDVSADEDDAPAPAAADAARTRPAKGASKRPRVDEPEPAPGEDAAGARAPVASGSQGSAPPPRRGFVKPPPEYSTVLVDDDADEGDADPFPFTTNPPTPHAKAQAKRAAAANAAGKGKAPRIARPASPSASSDEDLTPDTAPLPSKPSTSRSRRGGGGGTPPRADGAAALTVHETPVQVKNIALRAGMGPGTPATAARGTASARRSSVRGSGKRGSSIGGGFDAVPHPQVADDKLYRSTDASDPLARRLRSLLSWASQRARGRVLRDAPDELGAAERAAKEVMDGWVEDVCALRVDTSVPFLEPSPSNDPASLPPHPQNLSNAARLVELEAAYAAIAAEQAARHALEPPYQAFFDRRSAAHERPPPAKAWDAPAAFAGQLDVVRAGAAEVASLEEARALGRRVLKGELVRPAPEAPKDKKGKGKAVLPAAAADAPGVADAQIATAHLSHLAHRLSSFARVARAYVAHRGGETHAALGRLVASSSSASASAGAEEPAGLARHGVEAQVDPRELLRAIAGADAR